MRQSSAHQQALQQGSNAARTDSCLRPRRCAGKRGSLSQCVCVCGCQPSAHTRTLWEPLMHAMKMQGIEGVGAVSHGRKYPRRRRRRAEVKGKTGGSLQNSPDLCVISSLQPDVRILILQRKLKLQAPTLITQRDESVPHTPASFTKARL